MKVPAFWILSFICLTIFAKSIAEEPRIVCYYTNWSIYRPGNAKYSPQNINPYLCTHLIYAFGGFTKDNTLQPFDKYQDIEKGGYAKFTGLKTYNKNLKTLLAIGGWNEASSRFSPLVGDPARRRTFVKNAVKYLRQNHFDGLDLDWEYPTFRDGGKLKDRVNYAQFVQELREEFDRESSKTGRPRLLLTLAIPAGVDKIEQGYDVVKLNQYLDWFNVLTYDYHDSFEPATNHHAPLFSLEEDNEYNYDGELNIDFSVKHLINAGADRQKLVLGIPTYGRSYTLFNPDATEIGAPTDGPGDPGDATREKGFLAYYEICQNIKSGDDWTVMHPNDNVMGPYLYKDDQWISYDDEKMARKKAQYAAKNGLGGIMFWSIDTDDFRGTCSGKPYPLIEAAKSGLYDGLGVKYTESKEPVVKTTSTPRNRNRPTKKPLISSEGSTNLKETFNRRRKPSQTATAAPTKSSIVYSSKTTTPEPPTTPDPGSDFKCEDEGFFSHPRDCKKYFWCLDSGPSNLGIVAHQFTCPSGLVFNKQADSCDYARNVVCSKTKSSTTTTGSPPITTPRTTTKLSTTQRTTTFRTTTSRPTTTSTTTPAYEYEDEEYDDEDENTAPERDIEDPKVIKELIDLIKKAGGLDKLEKHLKFSEDNSPVFDTSKSDIKLSTTQATISKSLYDKVLIRKPENRFAKTNAIKSDREVINVTPKVNNTRYSSVYRNSRPSPQNAGLEDVPDFDAFLKEKPQYVTIQRTRTTTKANDGSGEVDSEDGSEEEYFSADTTTRSIYGATAKPQYVNIQRNRFTTETSDTEESDSEEIVLNPFSRPIESVTPSQYAAINRGRKPDSGTSSEVSLSSDTESAIQYSTINRGRRPDNKDSAETTSLPDIEAATQYATINSRRGPVNSGTVQIVSTSDTESTKYATFNRGRRPGNSDTTEVPSLPDTESTTQYASINSRPDSIDTTGISSPSDAESTTQYSSINRRRKPDNSDTTEISSPSDTESTTQYSSINRRRRPENSDTTVVSPSSDTESTTQYSSINRRRRPDNSETTEAPSEPESTTLQYTTVNRRRKPSQSDTVEISSVSKTDSTAQKAEVSSSVNSRTQTRYQSFSRGTTTARPLDEDTPEKEIIKSTDSHEEGIEVPIKRVLPALLNSNTKYQTITRNQIKTTLLETTPTTADDINIAQNHTTDLLADKSTQKETSPSTPDINHNLIGINLNHTNNELTTKHNQFDSSLTIIPTNTINITANQINTDITNTLNSHDHPSNETLLSDVNDVRANTIENVTEFITTKLSSPRPFGFQKPNKTILLNQTRAPKVSQVENLEPNNIFSYPINNEQANSGATVAIQQEPEIKPLIDRTRFRTSSFAGSYSIINLEQTADSNPTLPSTTNLGSNVQNSSLNRQGFRFSSSNSPNTNNDFSEQTALLNQALVESQNVTTNLGTAQDQKIKHSVDSRGFRISSSTALDSQNSTTNLDSNVGTQEAKFNPSLNRQGFRISSSSITDFEQTTISGQTVLKSQNSKSNLNTDTTIEDPKSKPSFDRRGFRISTSTNANSNVDFEQTSKYNQSLIKSRNSTANSSTNIKQSNRQGVRISSSTSPNSNIDFEQTTQTLIESQSTITDLETNVNSPNSVTDLEQNIQTLVESQNTTTNLDSNINTQESFDRRGFRISSSGYATSSIDLEQPATSNQTLLKSRNTTANLETNVNSQGSVNRQVFRISSSSSPNSVTDLEQTTQTLLESQNTTTNLDSNNNTQESFDRRGFRISSSSGPNSVTDLEQTTQTLVEPQNTTTNLDSSVNTQESFDRRGFRISSSASPTLSFILEQTSTSNQTSLKSRNTTTNLDTQFDRQGFRISSSSSPNSVTDVEQTTQTLLEHQNTTKNLVSNVNTQESFDRRGFRISSSASPSSSINLDQTSTSSQTSLKSRNTTTNLNTQFDRQGFRISSSSGPNSVTDVDQTTQTLLEHQNTTTNLGSNVNTQESFDRPGFRISSSASPSSSINLDQTSTSNQTSLKSRNTTTNLDTQFDRQGFRISSSSSPNSVTDLEQTTQTLLEPQNTTTNLVSNVNTQESLDRRGFRISSSASPSSSINLDQTSTSSQTSLKSRNTTTNLNTQFDRQGFRISSSSSPNSVTDLEQTTQTLLEPQNTTTNLVSNVNTQESFDRRGFRISSSASPSSSINLDQTSNSNQTSLKSRNTTTNLDTQFDRQGFRISSSSSPNSVTDLEQTTQTLLEPQNTTTNLVSNVNTQESLDRRGFRISSSASPSSSINLDQTSTSSQTSLKSRNTTTNLNTQFDRQGFRISSSSSPNSVIDLEQTTQTLLGPQHTTTNLVSNVNTQESFDRRGFRISSSASPSSSINLDQTSTSNQTSLKSRNTTTNLKTQFDRQGLRISSSSSPNSVTDFDQTTQTFEPQNTTTNLDSRVNTQKSFDRRGFRISSSVSPTSSLNLEQLSTSNQTSRNTTTNLNTQFDRQGFRISPSASSTSSVDIEQTTISNQTLLESQSSATNLDTNANIQDHFDQQGFKISSSTSPTSSIDLQQKSISSQTSLESQNASTNLGSNIKIQKPKFNPSFDRPGFEISSTASPNSNIDFEEPTISSQNSVESQNSIDNLESNSTITQEPPSKPVIDRRGFRVSSSTTEQTTGSNQVLFESRNSTANRANVTQRPKPKPTIDRRRFRVSSSTNRPAIVDFAQTTSSSQILAEPQSSTARTINRSRGTRKYFSRTTTTETLENFTDIPYRTNLTRKFRPVIKVDEEAVNYNSLLDRYVRPASLDELSSLTSFDFNRKNYNNGNPSVRRRPRPTVVTSTTTEEISSASDESNISTERSRNYQRPLSRNQYIRPTTAYTTTTTTTIPEILPNPVEISNTSSHNISSQIDTPYEIPASSTISPISLSLSKSFDFGFAARKRNSTVKTVFESDSRSNSKVNVTSQSIDTTTVSDQNDTTTAQIIAIEQNSLNVTTENNLSTNIVTNTTHSPETKKRSRVRTVKRLRDPVKQNANIENTIETTGIKSPTAINSSLANPTIETIVNEGFNFQTANTTASNSTLINKTESDIQIRRRLPTTLNTIEPETQTVPSIQRRRKFQSRISAESNFGTESQVSENGTSTNIGSRYKVVNRTVRRRPGTKLENNSNSTVNDENNVSENLNSQSVPRFSGRTGRPFNKVEVNSEDSDNESTAEENVSVVVEQLETSTKKSSFIPPRRAYTSRTSTIAVPVNIQPNAETETEIDVSENITSGPSSTSRPRFKVLNRTFTRRPLTQLKITTDEPDDEENLGGEEDEANSQVDTSIQSRKKYAPRFSPTQSKTETEKQVSGNINSPNASRYKVRAFTRKPLTNVPDNNNDDSEENLPVDDEELNPSVLVEPTVQARRKFITRPFKTAAAINDQSISKTEIQNSETAQRTSSLPIRRKFVSRISSTPANLNTQSIIENSSEADDHNSEEYSTSGEILDSVTLSTELNYETENPVSEHADSGTVTSIPDTTLEEETSEEYFSTSTEELKPRRRKIKIVKGMLKKKPETVPTLNSTEDLNETVTSTDGELEQTTQNDSSPTTQSNNEISKTLLNLEINAQDEENVSVDETELEFNAQKTSSTPTRRTYIQKIPVNVNTQTNEPENITSTSAPRFKVSNRIITRRPLTQLEVSSKGSVDDDNSDDSEVETNSQIGSSIQSRRKYVSRTSTTQSKAETESRVVGNINSSNVPRYKVRAFTRKPIAQPTTDEPVNDDDNSEENFSSDNEEVESVSQPAASIPTRRTLRPRFSTTPSTVNIKTNSGTGIRASGNSNSTNGSRFKVLNRTFTQRPSIRTTQQQINSEDNDGLADDDVESKTKVDSSVQSRRKYISRTSQAQTETGNRVSGNLNSSNIPGYRIRPSTRKPTTSEPDNNDNSEENVDLVNEDLESNTEADLTTDTVNGTTIGETDEIRVTENTNFTSASRFNSNATADDDDSFAENSTVGDREIESNTEIDNSTQSQNWTTQSNNIETETTSGSDIDDNTEENVTLDNAELESSTEIDSLTTVNYLASQEAENSRNTPTFGIFNRTVTRFHINANKSVDDNNVGEAEVESNSQIDTSIQSNSETESAVSAESLNSSDATGYKVRTYTGSSNDEDINSEETKEVESNTQPDSLASTRRTFRPRISTTPANAESEVQISKNVTTFKYNSVNRTRKPFGKIEINSNGTDDADNSEEEHVEDGELEPNTQIDATTERRKYISRITTTPAPPPLRFKVFNRTTTRKASTTPETKSDDDDDLDENDDDEIDIANVPVPRYKTFDRTSTRRPYIKLPINANEPDDTENTEDSQELESNSGIDASSQTERKYVSRISATQSNSEIENRVSGNVNSFNASRYGVINRTRKPFTRPETSSSSAPDNVDNSDENLADDEEVESNTQIDPATSNTLSNSGRVNSPIPNYKTFDRTSTRRPFAPLEINANEPDDIENSDGSEEFEANSGSNSQIDSSSQAGRTYGSQISSSQTNSETETRISGNNNPSNAPRYGVLNRTRIPFTRPTINANASPDEEENSDENLNSGDEDVKAQSDPATVQSNSGNINSPVPRYKSIDRTSTRRPFTRPEINANEPDDTENLEDSEEFEANSGSQISSLQTNSETETRISGNINSSNAPRYGVVNRTRKPFTRPGINLNRAPEGVENTEENSQIDDEEVEANSGNINSPIPRYKTVDRTSTRGPFTRLEINANEPDDTENSDGSEEFEANSGSQISSSQTNSETETRIFGNINSSNAPRYGVVNRTRKPFTRPGLNSNTSPDGDDNSDDSQLDDEEVEANSGNINLPVPRYKTFDRTSTRRPFTRVEINANQPDDTENSEDSEEFESNSQIDSSSQTNSQSNSESDSRISGNAPRYGVGNRTRKPFTRPVINANAQDNSYENSFSYNGEFKPNSPNNPSVEIRKKFVPRISNAPTSLNIQSSYETENRYGRVPARPSPNLVINTNDDDLDDDEGNDSFEENLTGDDEVVNSYNKFDTSTQSIRKFRPGSSANSVKLNTQSSSESSLPAGYRNKAIFQRKPYARPIYTNEPIIDSDNSDETVTIKAEDEETNTERDLSSDNDLVEATTIQGEFISNSETLSTQNYNLTQTFNNSEATHSLSIFEQTNSTIIESVSSRVVVNHENETELNKNDLDAGLVISNENGSFNIPATPTSQVTAKVINKPFSQTKTFSSNSSKAQSTQSTSSQNSPIQSIKIDASKYVPFHLRQNKNISNKPVVQTTAPTKFSHEEVETTTGSISPHTEYTNIPHSTTTLDTSTPIISTIADINSYSTLISQESTTTISAGDDADKVTETSISPLKKLKPTTTSKPTTLHHIFAVDYDSAEDDRNNGTNLGNSTELSDDDDSGTSKEASAEEISQRLEKLVEINRIVEIYSKQQSNGHNDLSSNSNELILEQIPTIDKIGEISRWISVKLQNHNSTKPNNLHEILRNITQLASLNTTNVINSTFDSKMIFDVETSTIPLEGLFDKNNKKKTLNDNEVIDYQVTKSPSPGQQTSPSTTPPPPPPPSPVYDSNPINLHNFAGSTSFGIASATIPSHNYVQQLRPESHEANPLVISIANLDQVVLSRSDKIDKKISFPSVISATESPNQLTFSSNSDGAN